MSDYSFNGFVHPELPGWQMSTIDFGPRIGVAIWNGAPKGKACRRYAVAVPTTDMAAAIAEAIPLFKEWASRPKLNRTGGVITA